MSHCKHTHPSKPSTAHIFYENSFHTTLFERTPANALHKNNLAEYFHANAVAAVLNWAIIALIYTHTHIQMHVIFY